MISDYFFYLACVIGFLLIVRVLYVYEKNYEQFKKELPEIVEKEQHEKAVKRAVRERYKRIESLSEIPRTGRELSEKTRLHQKKVEKNRRLILSFSIFTHSGIFDAKGQDTAFIFPVW